MSRVFPYKYSLFWKNIHILCIKSVYIQFRDCICHTVPSRRYMHNKQTSRSNFVYVPFYSAGFASDDTLSYIGHAETLDVVVWVKGIFAFGCWWDKPSHITGTACLGKHYIVLHSVVDIFFIVWSLHNIHPFVYFYRNTLCRALNALAQCCFYYCITAKGKYKQETIGSTMHNCQTFIVLLLPGVFCVSLQDTILPVPVKARPCQFFW